LLEHGGRLRRVAAETGTRPEDWLDLSTGISPFPWPVPEIPIICWSRLPEDEDGLVESARAYYGASSLLAVSGSQCAIQQLPRLRPPCRVAIVSPAYAEHAHAWRQNGHGVSELDGDIVEENLANFDVVVVINPNNPTGEYRTAEQLLHWHGLLQARGGWLVVDEAFMDPTPQFSLIAETYREGLIVLRSFGKFFGCPGARLGFVAANDALIEALRELVGPWPVGGPARWVGRLALGDRVWQADARLALQHKSCELADLLTRHGLPPSGGTPLFQWIRTERARRIHAHFLQHRILVRSFTNPNGLRFGLPGGPKEWERLRGALEGLPIMLAE